MDMTKVLGLYPGEEFILLNTIYHPSRKVGDEYSNDAISLILKNIETNEKIVKIVENPQIEAFVAKPHVKITHPQIIIPEEEVDKIDLSYRYVLRDIAKLAGGEVEQFYWNCIKSKQASQAKNVHKWNRLFSSDVDIEDFYRYKSLEHFGNKDIYRLSKAYFDIEADLMKGHIDLKNVVGDAPINAVTFVDDWNKMVYTFLLRNPDNPQVAEFEKRIPEFIAECNRDFDKEFGKLTYKVAMYNNEVKMIKDLFFVINAVKPDFLMAWNMGSILGSFTEQSVLQTSLIAGTSC